MRPALQRLLHRPSSLQLLRLILGPVPELPSKRATNLPIGKIDSCKRCGRAYSTAAAAAAELDPRKLRDEMQRIHERRTGDDGSKQTSTLLPSAEKPPALPIKWSESMFSHDDLQFESNVGTNDKLPVEMKPWKLPTYRKKLVDEEAFAHDIELWWLLLSFRHRLYGLDGIMMFWRAVKARNLVLPVGSRLADKFWQKFLLLGFHDTDVLQEICDYANRLYEEKGLRWKKLYNAVLQHMLLKGRGNEALAWHQELVQNHGFSPETLSKLVVTVFRGGGDINALHEIYRVYRQKTNVYSKVISLLCNRSEFPQALRWHYLLLANGDLPSSSSVSEPLIQYWSVVEYPSVKAANILRSLADAGVRPESARPDVPVPKIEFSREAVNRAHGEVIGVKPKPYSDSLGARWLATRYFSLDVAFTGLAALGVQEIGPLSLQSIALREPDCVSVSKRINQLREMGISIGSSLFSRAIEAFASRMKQDLLKGLLESDMHPDALEDWRLQEFLLPYYARRHCWDDYRRTLAIRLLDVGEKPAEKYNILIRTLVSLHRPHDIHNVLDQMNLHGYKIKRKTMAYFLQKYLPVPRPKSRTGTPFWVRNKQLNFLIPILLKMMQGGTVVPTIAWSSVLYYLCATARLQHFEMLSLFLAHKYKSIPTVSLTVNKSALPPEHDVRKSVPSHRSFAPPDSQPEALDPLSADTAAAIFSPTNDGNTNAFQSLPSSPAQQGQQVSRQLVHLPPSHPHHPLRLLFNTFQIRNLIYCSFIRGFMESRTPSARASFSTNYLPSLPHPCTSGLVILRKLRDEYGVSVDEEMVGKAVRGVLRQIYGPYAPDKRGKRPIWKAWRRKVLSLERCVELVNGAWGRKGLIRDMEALREECLVKGERMRRARVRRKARFVARRREKEAWVGGAAQAGF